MNVCIINQSDVQGGASIAGHRLYRALRLAGAQTRMIVGRRSLPDDDVALVDPQSRKVRLLGKFTPRIGLNYTHIRSTFRLHTHRFVREADVLNLHNLHGNYFNYLALPRLIGRGPAYPDARPAVLTLHDMWSFTGHCAYSFGCERWKSGCGKCPLPETYPAIKLDMTRVEWRLKLRVYERSRLIVVSPSEWLARIAKQSMLGRFEVFHVPNGLDLKVYRPRDRAVAREVFELPADALVLFTMAESHADPRKGSDLLVKALRLLPESVRASVVLLTAGHGGHLLAEQTGLRVIDAGYLASDTLKALAYSAADVFLFATRADNLPLVLQESMACGTPMVSFNIGGVGELVRDGQTGYAARAESPEDFAAGIVQLLSDRARLTAMRDTCRRIAEAEYDVALQAQRYMALFRRARGEAVEVPGVRPIVDDRS